MIHRPTLIFLVLMAFLSGGCEEKVDLATPTVSLSVDNPNPTADEIVRFTITGSAENYVLFTGISTAKGEPKVERFTGGDLRSGGGVIEARYNYGQDSDGGVGTYEPYVVATNVDGFEGRVASAESERLLITVVE